MKNYLLGFTFCFAIFKLQAQVTESKRNLCFVNHERIENSTYSVSMTSNIVFNELDGSNGAEAVYLNTAANKLLLVQNANQFAPPPSFPNASFQTMHYNPANSSGNVVSANFNTDLKADYAYINSRGDIYSFINTTTTTSAPYIFQTDSVIESLGQFFLVNASKLITANINNDGFTDLISVGLTGTGFKEYKFRPFLNTVTTSSSSSDFSPTVANPNIIVSTNSFVTQGGFDAVAADIDNNNNDELFFVSEHTKDTLYVYLNLTGYLDYKYKVKTTTLTDLVFKKIHVTDVNGDGKKEIAVLCKLGSTNQSFVYIYSTFLNGNVFGGVNALTDAIIPLGNIDASDFKLADINADGLKDVVVKGNGTSDVAIYIQDKPFPLNYDLLPRVFSIPNHTANSLSVADVDNNKRVDIISYSNSDLNSIAILKNLTYRDSLIATPSKTFICPGDTIQLTNKLIDFSFLYNSNIVPSLSLTSMSTHTTNITSGFGGEVSVTYTVFHSTYVCSVTSNSLLIKQRNSPNVSVIEPAIACFDEDFILTANGADTYTWYPSSLSTNPLTINSPKANVPYSVVGNSLGCTSLFNGTIEVNPEINAFIASDNNLLCNNQSATFSANGGASYMWQPGGETTQSIMVTQTTSAPQVYTATVYDANGCKKSVIFATVLNERCNEVTVKTGITPNNDGRNDYLFIENIENFPNNRVTIFNRWGVELYGESKYDNVSVVWPEKASELMPGTYYYVVDLGNGDPVQKGWIEILSN